MSAEITEPIDFFDLGLPSTNRDNGKQPVKFEVPKGVSENTFRHICSAAYTAYIGCRGLPSVDDIYSYSDKRVTKAKIAAVILTDEFYADMKQRGVPWRPDEYNGLSATQQYAIQILTNPVHERKTLQSKLRLAGVTYGQYRAWLKQPTFSKYLNQLTEGMLTDHVGDLHTKLMQKALDGDLNAIKYVHELSGRHDPNRQQVEDLGRVVNMLIEIITEEVKDQQTLTRIANKMQIAMAKANVVKGELAP